MRALGVERVHLDAALRAVKVTAGRHGDGSWVGTGDAYRTYCALRLPLGHVGMRHFLTALQALARAGRLESRVQSFGRAGRMTMFRLREKEG